MKTNTKSRRSRLMAVTAALPLAMAPAAIFAQTGTYEITFDEVSQGLVHGSFFTGNEYSGLGGGVTFSVDSNGSHDQLVVFDTTATGTSDPDLQDPFKGGNLAGLTNLGNALIIAENIIDNNNDGVADNPDDEGKGGTIGVVFGNANIASVGFSLYDAPEKSTSDVSITFKDGSGSSVTWLPADLIAHGSNVAFGNHYANEFEDITAAQLGLTNIQSIDFKIESGAIDSINFTAVPEPSSSALLGLGVMGLILRRKRG